LPGINAVYSRNDSRYSKELNMSRNGYVRDFSGFGSLYDLFDSVFSDFGFSRFDTQPRFNKLISSGDFPPTNVFVNNKTKEQIIEVALAGCSENDINLSFDGDNLKLVVDVPAEQAIEGDLIVLQRGLRKIRHIEVSWGVDPRFYDRDNVNVKLKDGLLTIKLCPREDVKPKKIPLFGKYEPAAIEENKAEA